MPIKKALILVDLQNDFCKGGSLEVKNGDDVVEVANRLQHHFDLVVVTKDWHPQNHMSFASNHSGHRIGDIIPVHGISQVLWPDHCVQHTKGAELHPQLKLDRIDHIVHKGTQKEIEYKSKLIESGNDILLSISKFLTPEERSKFKSTHSLLNKKLKLSPALIRKEYLAKIKFPLSRHHLECAKNTDAKQFEKLVYDTLLNSHDG